MKLDRNLKRGLGLAALLALCIGVWWVWRAAPNDQTGKSPETEPSEDEHLGLDRLYHVPGMDPKRQARLARLREELPKPNMLLDPRKPVPRSGEGRLAYMKMSLGGMAASIGLLYHKIEDLKATGGGALTAKQQERLEQYHEQMDKLLADARQLKKDIENFDVNAPPPGAVDYSETPVSVAELVDTESQELQAELAARYRAPPHLQGQDPRDVLDVAQLDAREVQARMGQALAALKTEMPQLQLVPGFQDRVRGALASYAEKQVIIEAASYAPEKEAKLLASAKEEFYAMLRSLARLQEEGGELADDAAAVAASGAPPVVEIKLPEKPTP